MKAIGYVRVSTEEQAVSGLGIDAQKAAILNEVRYRGWELIRWAVDDGVSGKHGVSRPALEDARKDCIAGTDMVLVAMKVDRFTRSASFLADLMREASHPRKGYRLVFLDMGGVDTGTPAGKMFVMMTGVFAEFERDLISQRTKDALAAKVARGERVGAARVIPRDVEVRIRTLRHDERLSMRQIAVRLQHDGVPTPRGGHWQHSTVAEVLRRT
jgi:DNA invertase Pin-like site-specific DNA recombinase